MCIHIVVDTVGFNQKYLEDFKGTTYPSMVKRGPFPEFLHLSLLIKELAWNTRYLLVRFLIDTRQMHTYFLQPKPK